MDSQLTSLSPHEQLTKARCKLLLGNGKRHFLRTCRTLVRINRYRLYRDQYKTFDDYVQAEFGIGARRAYQLIAAALVSTTVHIENERQARELKRLPASIQPLAWDIAKNMASQVAPGKPIPSTIVKAAVNIVDTAKVTGGYVDTGDGKMSAMDAAVTQEVHEIQQRQRQHIASAVERKNGINPDVTTKYTGTANVKGIMKPAHLLILKVPDDLLNSVRKGQDVTYAVYVKIEATKSEPSHPTG